MRLKEIDLRAAISENHRWAQEMKLQIVPRLLD